MPEGAEGTPGSGSKVTEVCKRLPGLGRYCSGKVRTMAFVINILQRDQTIGCKEGRYCSGFRPQSIDISRALTTGAVLENLNSKLDVVEHKKLVDTC